MALQPSEKLLLLLQKPGEPVFLPKGDGNYVVDVPDVFIAEELRPLKPIQADGITIRDGMSFSGGGPAFLPVSKLELPDMSPVYAIPRGTQWSVFYDQHKEAANILMGYMRKYNPDQLFSFLAVIRDNVNEQMFSYCLMSTIIRRPDLRNLIPSMGNIFEYFPDRFLGTTKVREVQNREKVAVETGSKEILVINQTFAATDKDPENRLAYFREDLGVNSHHWHWHLVYPDDASVQADRRGELFYYMHRQVIARYDAERFSNGLPIVQPFHRLEEPIPEAYFGKLTDGNSGQVWGSRPAGLRLQDIELPERESFTIQDLVTWRDRIRHAIHSGVARASDGKDVKLDEITGIDILGNMLEPAAAFSVNPRFYGSFHNKGHLAFGHIHDPAGAHKENGGPMVDTLTAMRDPIFYRWHKHVDNIFGEFKASLQPYTATELGFPGIAIRKVSVSHSNVISTGWGKSRINLAQGLTFQNTNEIVAEVQHLFHENFEYNISVQNKTKVRQNVCFRVFIAPYADETGRKLDFREQRAGMIEMDKFTQTVQPGDSEIDRSSKDSTVTIPIDRFFRAYERTGRSEDLSDFERFCGCGWPHHMLVPKGNKEGMRFDLFVIATDWSKDGIPVKTTKACNRGTSYCGILDEKYPDKQAMGYPFDRPLATRGTTFDGWRQKQQNIAKGEITVVFKDRIIRTFGMDA